MPNNGPVNPLIVNDLNLLINQLNGFAGYSGTPQIVSIGANCNASGATPQTCNGGRGQVTFTGVTVAAVSTAAVVINDSLVTTASACLVSVQSTTAAAGSFPYVNQIVPTAGVLTVTLANAAAATSTGSSTFVLNFQCIN